MKGVLKLARPRVRMEMSWYGFMGVPSSFVTIQRTYMFVFKYILSLCNSTSNKIKPQPRQSNAKLIYIYLDSKVPRLQFAAGLDVHACDR